MKGKSLFIEYDWFNGDIPNNIIFGKHVYIDTSYSFAFFLSQQNPGLILGDCAGVYLRTTFVVGPEGYVSVGSYTCLNGAYLISNECIKIGSHCLLAWGSVITDTFLDLNSSVESRRAALKGASLNPNRLLSPVSRPFPVKLEDNVWVGFESVILPGVTLGQGCVIGCKTVISEDIPPYAVVVGDPSRIVRYLEPDDTEAARQRALKEYIGG